MVKTETFIIRDIEYTRTYSDLNMMIERDGAMYSEAADPLDSGRTYTETDIPITDDPTTPEQMAEALGILGVTV